MAQDPNQQSQYSTGYGGYTPQPNDPSRSQQAGQQSFYDPQAGQQSSYGQQQQQQQQYGTSYQPPRSATRGTTADDPTTTRMNARTAALLSYLLWWFSGLIFFLIERKNRFVRFHAAQSFIFFGTVSVLYAILKLISLIPILGFLLSPFLTCATLIIVIPAVLIWLFLMLQAYRGVYVRLPIFSEYAERLVSRFSKKGNV